LFPNFATSFSIIIDTGGKFATAGVVDTVDTSGKFATGINNTSETVCVAKFATNVVDTGGNFADGGCRLQISLYRVQSY
jgi:hypothetical protein